MWADLKERFLKFETIHGLYKIPLGLLIIFVALLHLQYILHALGALIGLKALVEGLHDLFHNPVKAKIALNNAVAKRIQEKANGTPDVAPK